MMIGFLVVLVLWTIAAISLVTLWGCAHRRLARAHQLHRARVAQLRAPACRLQEEIGALERKARVMEAFPDAYRGVPSSPHKNS